MHRNFFIHPFTKLKLIKNKKLNEYKIKIFIETINFISCGNLMDVNNSPKSTHFKTELFKYKKYSNLHIVLLTQNY